MAYESRLACSHDELKVWVAECYGLDVDVDSVRVGYMSTVVWLTSRSASYILKVYGDEDLKQIEYGLNVAAHLRHVGLPVAACFHTLGKKSWAELHGRIAVLWSCLLGDLFEIGNHRQLAQAGRMLGQYHRESQALLNGEVGYVFVDSIKTELQATWAMVKGAEGFKMVKGFGECLEDIWDSVQIDLPTTVLHCDFRAQNLLFEQDELSGILDLDGSCVGPRIFDLVYALAFFQAVVAKEPLSLDEMVIFIRAYDAEIGLADVELEGLNAWFTLALLKGMTLWLRIGYVDGGADLAKEWLNNYSTVFETRQGIVDGLVYSLRGKG